MPLELAGIGQAKHDMPTITQVQLLRARRTLTAPQGRCWRPMNHSLLRADDAQNIRERRTPISSAMRAGSFLLMTTPLNNGGIAPICRVMLFRLLAHGTRRACRGESHRISRRSIWMDDGRGGNGPGTRFGHPKMPCPLGGGSEKKEGTDVAPVPQVSERAFPARTNRHRVRRCPAALVAKGNPKEAVRLIRVDVSS